MTEGGRSRREGSEIAAPPRFRILLARVKSVLARRKLANHDCYPLEVSMVRSPSPAFFQTPADWRRWLSSHHKTKNELWVGFHKRGSGRPSITWPEAVDEALCFGWIDGIRKSLGATSYMIRFTPRRPDSNWSQVNLRRVVELAKLGRMRPAGRKVHEERKVDKTGVYKIGRAHV